MTGIKALWRLLTLPCEGMTRLASESLDRDLTRLERVALRSHLLYCGACRRFVQQVAVLRRAVRRIEAGAPLPGPGLPDDARDRIKRALREN
jgi:predicted anti-sigma-YlaC factor YlaD